MAGASPACFLRGSGEWDERGIGCPPLAVTFVGWKCQFPAFAVFLRVFASGTGYPIHARNTMLPKHQTQLRGMFLNMSHTVQLKLQETGFHPLEHAALLGSLIC